MSEHHAPERARQEQPAGALGTEVALELFLGLLGRTYLTAPAEVAAAVAEQARGAGGEDVVLYLVDYEQRHLVPVPVTPAVGISTLGWDGGPGENAAGGGAEDTTGRSVGEPAHGWDRGEAAVEGTMPGRCFATTTILQAPADVPERRRLWLPLLDGTDRLGVLALTVPAPGHDVPEPVLTVWERFAHLVAQVVVSKRAYGDAFEIVRRSRRMSLAGELQWGLLPPLTFASPGLVVSAMLEPSYEDGGDAFDYAVNADTVHFAIFDAMGHGLGAAGAAAFALVAYRRARRAGLDLPAAYAAVDVALAEQYGGDRYATAVLAELGLATGQLSWINAGHPEPLLLRAGKLVKTLAAPPATPLGVPFTGAPLTVGREQLEPGDRVLLYTDGLPEARQPNGGFFSLERLVDFIERAGAAGYPAPETLRRLGHAVLQHQHGALQDDASALLLEWRRGSEHALLPQTVEREKT